MSSPALAEPPEPALERAIERTRRLRDAGRPAQALALARRLVRRASGAPEAALVLAELRLPASAARAAARPPDEAQAAAQEASHALEAALRAHPEHAELRRALAWALAVEGDHLAAIEQVAADAGRLDTRAAAALRRLAALAVRRHDLAAADRALALATRADPTDANLRADQATVALARGRADRAVRLYRLVLESRPNDPQARRDLAAALLARGDGEEAMALLKDLTSDPPDAITPQIDLARAALETHRFSLAASTARRAHRISQPDDARAAVLLGLALQGQQRPDEAARAFREALRRDPTHARARRALRALEGRAEGLDAPEPRDPSGAATGQ